MNRKNQFGQNSDTERIRQLIVRYFSGGLSEDERAELDGWLAADKRHKSLLDELNNGSLFFDELSAFSRPDTDATLQRLREQMADTNRLRAGNVQKLRRLVSYAAAILIVTMVGVWFYPGREQTKQHSKEQVSAADIVPGGNRAMLTLADGRKIDLSEEQQGIIVGDGIMYLDGSAVIEREKLKTENDAFNSHLSAFNSITTPKGGMYQITLPDGSKAWLNANSTLEYPNRFDGDERIVRLVGEAYFSITQKRMATTSQNVPFKVLTADQEVQVLGTEFNVSAYPDEQETKTTLVSGSVAVRPNGTPVTLNVSPGEQGLLRNGVFSKSAVDTDQFTAWKDGYFYFDGLSPEVALAQLSRWYDLDVVYQGKIPSVSFFGEIERSKPLAAILKILEKSGLRFDLKQVDGRNRLIVFNE